MMKMFVSMGKYCRPSKVMFENVPSYSSALMSFFFPVYAHVTNPHSQDTSPDSQVSQNPTENISAYPENTFLVQNELVHGNKDQFNSEIPDNLTFSDLLLVDDALKDIDLSLYDAKD